MRNNYTHTNKKMAFIKLLQQRIRKRNHGNKIIGRGIGMPE